MISEQAAHIEELVAREAITEVLNAYCAHVDANEPEKVAALFQSDCTVDYGPGLGGPIEGAEALAKGMGPGLARFDATHHQLSNVRISLEGRDRATAVSYVTAWHRFPGDTPDAILYGQYHDVLVRHHGKWRFQERRLLAAGESGFGRFAWAPAYRRSG